MKIPLRPFEKLLHRRPGVDITEIEVEEDPATQPSLEFKVKTPTARRTTRKTNDTTTQRTQVVCFVDKKCNTYHASPWDSKEECRAMWYNGAEIAELRHKHRQQAMDLRDRRDGGHVTQSYMAAYQVCVQAETPVDMVLGLSWIPQPPKLHWGTTPSGGATVVGLEKRGVPGVSGDTTARRQQLWTAVLGLQQRYYDCYGVAAEDRVIRAACRRITRPSRLYARHIALVSASSSSLPTTAAEI